MRQRTLILTCSFIWLLAACTTSTPAPIATSSPTAVPFNTTEAVPTAAPSPTTVPLNTTGAAATYAPRPTATPYQAGSQTESGVYRNPDYGIKLHYPDQWSEEPPDKGSDVLQYFVSPTGGVASGLLVNPANSADVKSAAKEVHTAMLNGLNQLTILSDEAVTLTDNRSGWSTLATAKRSDGSDIKINLVTTLSNGRAITLFVFSTPPTYDQHLAEVKDLIAGLTIEQSELYGIPRDQALVLAGGESTNPREYDPATTHGSGDK